MDILALSGIWKTIAVFWVISAVILILIILLQKGKGAGLGGAFGAGAPGGGLLGTKTGDFFTWVTIIIAAIVLLLPVLLGVMAASEKNGGAPTAPAVQTAPAVPVEMPTAEEVAETAKDVADEAAEKAEDVVEQANEAVNEAVDAAAKIEVTVPDVNK